MTLCLDETLEGPLITILHDQVHKIQGFTSIDEPDDVWMIKLP